MTPNTGSMPLLGQCGRGKCSQAVVHTQLPVSGGGGGGWDGVAAAAGVQVVPSHMARASAMVTIICGGTTAQRRNGTRRQAQSGDGGQNEPHHVSLTARSKGGPGWHTETVRPWAAEPPPWRYPDSRSIRTAS